MLNVDLMKFKDEVLKNIREIENKIMIKVNKNQNDLSSDINQITYSIEAILEKNNSVSETMAQQKIAFDKISNMESFLKEIQFKINEHEKKINNSLVEIINIKGKNENKDTELLIPGIIGRNCRYESLNDYIVNTSSEIEKLNNEKDKLKRESKDTKFKVDKELKNISTLIDSSLYRTRAYTDNSKKEILKVLDQKFIDLSGKNLELSSRLLEIEEETVKKIKKYLRSNILNFNEEREKHMKNIDSKIIEINRIVAEFYSKYEDIKKNEEIYEEYINEIKNFIEKNSHQKLKIDSGDMNIINSWNKKVLEEKYNQINNQIEGRPINVYKVEKEKNYSRNKSITNKDDILHDIKKTNEKNIYSLLNEKIDINCDKDETEEMNECKVSKSLWNLKEKKLFQYRNYPYKLGKENNLNGYSSEKDYNTNIIENDILNKISKVEKINVKNKLEENSNSISKEKKKNELNDSDLSSNQHIHSLYNKYPMIKGSQTLNMNTNKKNNNNKNNNNKNNNNKNNNNKNNIHRYSKTEIAKKDNKKYNIVKIKIDNNMTPYNTNGLVTLISKRYKKYDLKDSMYYLRNICNTNSKTHSKSLIKNNNKLHN